MSQSQAFSVPSSQVWDGNDGAWSTFVIRVGKPAQYFRVLPATSSDETWVPVPDHCDRGIAWCGNARGVEPFNAGTSGPASGSPTSMTPGSLDAGSTCTANKSPMCVDCVSINGKCTNGPCAGRTCCGAVGGQCNSGGCNGISGLCTAAYIGCPCPGPDYNAGFGIISDTSAANPLNAQGFLPNTSSSWSDQGSHRTAPESLLNQTAQAQYGLDTVGIGPDASTGLTLNGSVVAGIPAVPFYLGKIGLKPSNTSGPSRGSQSLMSQLVSQGKIPSSSFGYSAGALYKSQPVLGSLTLGGYDVSRIIPNSMTFQITDSTSLRVPIQAITATGTLQQQDETLLSDNITALIDTTTPHSWLPMSVCHAFETAFGLTWDSNSSYYLVNDTTHQQLLTNNPSVTFSFRGLTGRSIESGAPSTDAVNITLPYGAFDLQAAQPIYTNGTNYFPIRRASNGTQYTIGRSIFQEAYLTVDYEAGNFSISQAKYPVPPNATVVTINHHPVHSSAPSSSGHDLSKAAVAGVLIGVSAISILLCSLGFLFYRYRRNKVASAQEQAQGDRLSSIPRAPSPSTLQEKTDPSFGGGIKSKSFSSSTSPTSMRSPITNELEDPYSPANTAGNTWNDEKSYRARGYSISKPLPQLPVELAGEEFVDELMDSRRSGHGSPRAIRNHSGQSRRSGHSHNGRQIKHIFEMTG